jgi:aromatic-L-amino-acid decarboxylase
MIFPSGGDADPRTDSQPGSALADREGVLRELAHYLSEAWTSFDHPRPVEPQPGPDLLARLDEVLPDDGSDPHAALRDAVQILESSTSPSRPLYLAYVGSSGLEASVLASALLAAYDANLATAAGAADLLDQQAVRWVAEFIGFPLAEGHFTSGGQTSNLTGILAAREAALPGAREHGMGGHRATVYCSEEAHHSVARAVEAAGIGRRSLRRIAIDAEHRMRPDALADAVARDRADGFTPVAVVATAGTTLTGAVDPIDAIAEICEREGVGLHVDGAYGLPAAATTIAADRFRGLDRADSATIDAHKWLGMQKACSIVLVRRPGALRAAFGHEETYMLHEADSANPVDSTFEYSRPFRSLKFWLSMRVHGADQFRTWISATLKNAEQFTDEVRAAPGFELLHEPMLSTVCFRHVPDGMAEADLDAHNQRLADAMQVDGRVYLAPAALAGRTCLRVCFVNYRTTAEDVALVLRVARELGEALAG